MNVKIFLFTGLFLINFLATAKTTASNYKPDIQLKLDKKTKKLNIKIQIPEDIKFNEQGPWSISYEGNVPFLGKTKNKLKSNKDFTPKDGIDTKKTYIWTYSLSTKELPKKPKSDFKIVYMVCNNDVTWCKPVKVKRSI